MERIRIEETNLRTAHKFIIYNTPPDGTTRRGSEDSDDSKQLDESVYIGESWPCAMPSALENAERNSTLKANDSLDIYRFIAPVPNETSHVSFMKKPN